MYDGRDAAQAALDTRETTGATRRFDPRDAEIDVPSADAAEDGREALAEAPEIEEARPSGFWRAIAPFVAVVTVLAGVLDAVSTEVTLATGLAWEANPVVRAIQAEIGSWWVAPKLIVHFGLAAVVLWFPRPFTLIVLGALAAVTLAAAANNFAIYVDILTDKDGDAAMRTILSAF